MRRKAQHPIVDALYPLLNTLLQLQLWLLTEANVNSDPWVTPCNLLHS